MVENIKEKIAKILELARRGGTEAESATALRMAHELLAKHNLEMSDVQNVTVEDEDIVEQGQDVPSRAPWQGIIWAAICPLYFCEVYSTRYVLNGKNKKSFRVVGKSSNVETALSTVNYLVALGEELSSVGKNDALYRNSWKSGYSSRIAERCRETKQAAIKKLAGSEEKALAGSEEKALAVINLYTVTKQENTAFLAAKGVHLGGNHRTRGSIRDSAGFAAGKAAGGQVSLRGGAAGRIG